MSSTDTDTEPAPDVEPAPVTTSSDPLADRPIRVDAPEAARSEFFRPTVGARVSRPGQAEVAGTGRRDPVSSAHNWVPIGPRNVGGRVRAIAIDPAHPEIMYAAPASGGVYKSLDGAESWFPLWHDEPSLSMAALSLCRAHPEVVWAGTGESVAGGGETIPGAGVWRSGNGGETWRGPEPNQAILDVRIHAIAAHPTDGARCWAATDNGLYRTIDGGLHWTQFAESYAFTDVLLAEVGGQLRLFAALQGPAVDPGPPERREPIVVRVDEPDHTDAPGNPASATLAGLLPTNPFDTTIPDPLSAISGTFDPPPADGGLPADGKLALYSGGAPGFADPVLYVVFSRDNGRFFGLFRCRNAANADPNALTWTRIAPAPVFPGEKQGRYNLALAVSPLNPNHLAFGMVELYLHERAAATAPAPTAANWKRLQMWDLYHLERGHHADHHQLVFSPPPTAPFRGGVPADTLVLWDANDGGVSACSDWLGSTTYPISGDTPTTRADATFPPPAGSATWRKRSHGISASQMYDLTQHPRLPTVVACGFQDNGAFLATGGLSWQLLVGADGGFIAFDPDDPYRMIVTWQEGVAETFFPGRLRGALPLLREGVTTGLWPRQLSDGFLHRDQALFVAETAFHPTAPGRVLTARRNRLYATRPTTGERWIAEPLGPGIEIVHRPTGRRVVSSSIEVHDTPAAIALGLLPQRTTTEVRNDPRMASRVRSLAGQPFAIPDGGELVLTFSGDGADAGLATVRIRLRAGGALPARATSAQLAAYLDREIKREIQRQVAGPPVLANPPQVDVLNTVWSRSAGVVVASTGTGRARRIRFDSSDTFLFGPFVAREYLGAAAGGGGQALPAIVPLSIASGSTGTDVSGQTMHFERENGTAVVDIDCDIEFPDPHHAYPADLAAVLRRKLPPAEYAVWSAPAAIGLRLAMTAGVTQQLRLEGNLVAALALEPGARGRTVLFANTSERDLRPTGAPAVDRTLRVREAAGRDTATQALDAAFVGVADLTQVTSVELCDAVRRMIDAAGDVRVRCDLDVHPVHTVDEESALSWETSTEGSVSEIAFGPPGSRRAWAGDTAGRLYRTTDDGGTWEEVESPFADRFAEIEAIAVRPDDPDRVLVAAYLEGAQAAPARMIARTTTGGPPWTAAAQILDANGDRVGVHALVFDTHAPGHAYAATDIGVFHSPDGGSSWDPFNQGLPNARVIDLAYEPTTRMLRAGVWGRGVYERHLGDRPARDVLLHIRSTQLDDGTSQPLPGPDLLAPVATALRLDASPDVKQLRSDPRRRVALGGDPLDAAALGASVLDGVEFDEDVVSTDVRVGPAFVAVQVLNRGAFTTSTARAAVLWAPAAAGPPPVPAALRDAIAAGPLAPGARFDAWTVIGDEAFADPHGAGHDRLAPGYPRVAVFGGAAPFAWTEDDLRGLRRVGLLALCRCDEDPLRLQPGDVLDLVRSEAKAAYRECDVVAADVDARTVIRALSGPGFRVQAPTGGGVANGANGAAPFGLAATGAGVREARFARPEPYDLSAGDVGFRLTVVHDPVVVAFAADDPTFRNVGRTDAVEVSAVVNRALVAADVPVRATSRQYAGGTDDAVRLTGLPGTRFSVAGTAGLLGLNGAGATAMRETPIGQRGPWNLTPPAAGPRELRIEATTTVEVRLGPRTREIADPAAATASEVRAALHRQLMQSGVTTVVAEPAVQAVALRRTATEAAGTRVVSGGHGLADIVVSADAILTADLPARFRALAEHDLDRFEAGRRNRVYVRVANTGTVRLANPRPARIAVHELTIEASQVSRSDPALGSGTRELDPGASATVEIAFDLEARPSGSRLFLLVVVDSEDVPLAVPEIFASLDEAHAFCLDQAGAAIREVAVE